MNTLLGQLLGAGVALLLLTVSGYGAALFLLPQHARRYCWVAAPVVGLAVLALSLGWLNLWLPVKTAIWVHLGLAVLLAIAATRYRGFLRWEDRREQLVVGLVALIGFAVVISPLWGREELLSIGPNWDTEIYLPMAEYLKEYPLGFSLTEPAGGPFPAVPNPLLWRVNFFDPRWAGVAFSQLHAAAGALTSQPAEAQMSGLLALLHALTILSTFLAVRGLLQLPRATALVITGLAALNPTLLFVPFWGFGQQASALPLLPLAASAAALALRPAASRLAVVLAGLTVAGLLASFAPALVVLAAFVLVLVMLTSAMTRHAAPALLAIEIALVSLILAPWAYLRVMVRAAHYFIDGGVTGLTSGPDVTAFPSLGWSIGLLSTPESGLLGLLSPDASEGLLITRVVLSVAVILLGAAIVAGWRAKRLELVATALAPLFVLLPLRFVLEYPYGYLKTVPLVAFMLVTALVVGAGMLLQLRPLSAMPRAARGGLGFAALVLLVLNAVSAKELVISIGQQSTMTFSRLGAIEKLVPPGAEVYVSGHYDLHGPKGGALAYFLRNTQLYGFLQTGYSTFYREKADDLYEYAVYSVLESPPRELLYRREPLWEGEGLLLFRLPEDIAQYDEFGRGALPPVIERTGGPAPRAGLRISEWTDDGYPQFQGWSPPLLGTLAETVPPEATYPELIRRGRFEGNLLAPRTARGRELMAGPLDLALTLATFKDQEASVTVNGVVQKLDLTHGLATYSLGAGRLPVSIVVENESATPVYVKSAMARRAGGATAAVYPEAILVRTETKKLERGFKLTLDYSGPAHIPTLDLYSVDGQTHLGGWRLPAARATPRHYELRFDVMQQALFHNRRSGEVRLQGSKGESPDGNYRGYLFLRDGDKVVQVWIVCSFSLRAGRLGAVEDSPTNLIIS